MSPEAMIHAVKREVVYYDPPVRTEAASQAIFCLWRLITQGKDINVSYVQRAVKSRAADVARAERRYRARVQEMPEGFDIGYEQDTDLVVWSAAKFTATIDPVAAMVMLLVGAGERFGDAERRVRGPVLSDPQETKCRMANAWRLWEAS